MRSTVGLKSIDAMAPEIAGVKAAAPTVLVVAFAVLMMYNLLAFDKAYNSPVAGRKSILNSFSPEPIPAIARRLGPALADAR